MKPIIYRLDVNCINCIWSDRNPYANSDQLTYCQYHNFATSIYSVCSAGQFPCSIKVNSRSELVVLTEFYAKQLLKSKKVRNIKNL